MLPCVTNWKPTPRRQWVQGRFHKEVPLGSPPVERRSGTRMWAQWRASSDPPWNSGPGMALRAVQVRTKRLGNYMPRLVSHLGQAALEGGQILAEAVFRIWRQTQGGLTDVDPLPAVFPAAEMGLGRTSYVHPMLGVECVSSKCIYWNPNPWHLRMWPYLRIGSLQM